MRCPSLPLLLTLLLTSLSALCGCHAGKVFIASTGDYADYRRVRVAADVDERMAAAWYYLEERPDGQYAERLTRYFDKAEPVFYKVRRRSMKGLEAYLRALPNGPHAKVALDELLALREESGREELATRQARQSQIRLDYDRDKRKDAAGLLSWWLTALMEQVVWDKPLSQAPKELVVRYRLSLPRPQCVPHEDNPDHRRCFKTVARGFRVAGEGKLVDRNIGFELELVLDDKSMLRRATIGGPSLFVSTAEAGQQRVLDGDDTELRAKLANDFVNQLIQTLLERDIACNGGTDAAGNTALDCEQLRIIIEPGRGGGDDVMFIERIVSAPAAAAATVDDDDDADEGDDDDDDDDDDEGDDAESSE